MCTGALVLPWVQMWEKTRNTRGRLLYTFLLKMGPQNFRYNSFLTGWFQPRQERVAKVKPTTKSVHGELGGKPCGGEYFLELDPGKC